MPSILNNIATIEKATSTKGSMKEMLKHLSIDNLGKMIDSMKNHKDTTRFIALTSAIFTQDMENISAAKQIVDTSESTLVSFVELIFVKEYYDKKYEWKKYEDDVMEAIKHVASSEGASSVKDALSNDLPPQA